jgi:nucleoid-associated protein YgaU
MIFTDSRYATGRLAKAYDSRTGESNLTVFRQFPFSTKNYSYYTWTQRDRIDVLARQLLGDPSLWWVIMDFNPEVGNAFNIPIGTVLRIPRG